MPFKSSLSMVVLVFLCLILLGTPFGEVQAASETLLLSEVQTGAVGDSGLEFIEIFNAGGLPVGLEGMSVAYLSASGSSESTVFRFQESDIIADNGYFLLVHSGRTVSGTADDYFNVSLAAAGGGLALRDNENRVVDSLGWGTAANAFVEGTAAEAPGAGSSLARTGFPDSDNNRDDFQLLVTPEPQGSADPVTVPLPLPLLTLGGALLAVAALRVRYGN